MKTLIILTTFLVSQIALAVGPAPKELQGGKITVSLKDGKTYTFSSDEYAVVKRGSEATSTHTEVQNMLKSAMDAGKLIRAAKARSQQPKNIISVGVVRSKNGFNTKMTNSTVDVESRKDFGGSLQYQRRVKDNNYIGGRADTNGGLEINLGFGF